MCPDPLSFPLSFPQDYVSGFDVALFEPDIPLNVGSIARTCAITRTPLHLVGRVGFILDDRIARRAGLDYWEQAEVHIHPLWNDFIECMGSRRMFLFSTKGRRSFWEAEFMSGDVFVFGSEGSGLPEEIRMSGVGEALTIPMVRGFRSLNLSNCVAIALYEGLRQRQDKKGI